MQLKFKHNLYWLKCTYAERQKPSSAGFKWNRANSLFFTADPWIAGDFIDYAVDQETIDRLSKTISSIKDTIESSKASSSELKIPKPDGMYYYPFQKAGIEFALDRDATLIADVMRLGKTIQAIGFANVKEPVYILVICPATVKINWQREFEKWLVGYSPVGVAYGSEPWPTDPIIIINYDILIRFPKQLHGRVWDLVVIDECQYLKNPDAKRTQMIYGDKRQKLPPIQAKHKLALSGTPILSRPIEIFSTLHYLAPKVFPSYWKFGMRYCGGYNAENGWDFTGASNLDELNHKLRSTVMVRRTKKDVLEELPEKTRQIIELPANGQYETALRIERRKMISYKQQVKNLGTDTMMAFEDISLIRHETSLAKVPMVVRHLKSIINSGEKVVCFAWHHDVIEGIREKFEGHMICGITGKTSPRVRQSIVDAFQGSPDIKLFLGNIKAAGVGIPLHASQIAVFAELDWVPGNITQAEERIFNFEKPEPVLIQHLVLEGSIDAYMAKILIHKQEIIDQALDGKGEDMVKADDILNELFENY